MFEKKNPIETGKDFLFARKSNDSALSEAKYNLDKFTAKVGSSNDFYREKGIILNALRPDFAAKKSTIILNPKRF